MGQSCTPQPELPFEVPERWLPVESFEHYEVSDLGRVRSIDRIITVASPYGGTYIRRMRGRVLRPSLYEGQYGYLLVSVYQDKQVTKCYVHRLVAAAFLGPCPPGEQVRHGPNGKLDNRASQLCYGTREKNAGPDRERDGTLLYGESSPVAKLTEAQITEIRARYAAGGICQRDLASELGVSRGNISVITRGDGWKRVKEGPIVRRSVSERNGLATLTEALVREIRARHAAGEHHKALAYEGGVTPRTIRRIISGRTWKQT
jgi:DNA-binding XRE family transcriptional regulator